MSDLIFKQLEIVSEKLNLLGFSVMCSCVKSAIDKMREIEAERDTLREEMRKAMEQEPVHWRAVISDADKAKQPDVTRHVVGFTALSNAEDWIAAELDFGGWNYSIEPLYASPVPAQKDALLSSTFALWWAMIRQRAN